MKYGKKLLSAVLCSVLIFNIFGVGVRKLSLTAAASETESAEAASTSATEEIADEVESDLTEGWPEGPEINAEAAVVMEADTGAVLYSKNLHKSMYPASTTKLMTALLAYENLDLDEMVTFSQEAISNVDYGSTTIGLDAGESLSVSDCLYALLVASANEVANGIAEKVGGTQQSFVRMMNQRAQALGCKDTHFANTNGLYNEDHFTSVYDMALIAREFFSYDALAEYANTPYYHFEATATQPDDFTVANKHKLINGEMEYEGVIGGKTGYLDAAGQTLVTAAERDGVRLICVVFKEESPDQFTDTVTLFDYGFDNFKKLRVSDYETSYGISNPGFFQEGNDIVGSNTLPYSISGTGYVVIPKDAAFADLQSFVETNSNADASTDSGSDAAENLLGTISYTYNGTYVGSAQLLFTGDSETETAESQPESEEADTSTENTNFFSQYFDTIVHIGDNGALYINLPLLLLVVIVLAAIVITVIMVVSYRRYLRRRRRRKRTRTRRKV